MSMPLRAMVSTTYPFWVRGGATGSARNTGRAPRNTASAARRSRAYRGSPLR